MHWYISHEIGLIFNVIALCWRLLKLLALIYDRWMSNNWWGCKVNKAILIIVFGTYASAINTIHDMDVALYACTLALLIKMAISWRACIGTVTGQIPVTAWLFPFW